MNKKDAMKWVNALRSGKYKQGEGTLYCGNSNKYCCLGVLNKILPHKYTRSVHVLDVNSNFKTYTGSIPSLDTTLVELNDNLYRDKDGTAYNLNFDEIADIIQICYEEL